MRNTKELQLIVDLLTKQKTLKTITPDETTALNENLEYFQAVLRRENIRNKKGK